MSSLAELFAASCASPSTSDAVHRLAVVVDASTVDGLRAILDASATTAVDDDADHLLAHIHDVFYAGHWSTIAIEWRRAWSLVSLLKATHKLQRIAEMPPTYLHSHLQTVMYDLDYGLIMGAPLDDDNVLAVVANRVHDLLAVVDDQLATNQLPTADAPTNEHAAAAAASTSSGVDARHRPNPASEHRPSEKILEVERVYSPSIEQFVMIVADGRPVIVTNVVTEWPAYSNLDYIRKTCGYRYVPIETGKDYTDSTFGQEIITVNEFIDEHFDDDERRGYLAQHQLFSQLTRLCDDFVTPDYCHVLDDEFVNVNAWFGPRSTLSPLHTDPRENLLAQVMGSKRFLLVDRQESSRVYPHAGMQKNTSQVDVFSADLEKFPEFQNVQKFEGVLRAGEMLYIPQKWWHCMHSLEPSFSISFWFGPSSP